MEAGEFIDALACAGTDKQSLLALMSSIDTEKRRLKELLRAVAQDPKYSMKGMGNIRQNTELAIKNKLSVLIGFREIVQRQLGKLNKEEKRKNRLKNRHRYFLSDFYTKAEEILDASIFEMIEKAALDVKHIIE